MSDFKNNIISFFKSNDRQKWFLIGYCSFILLLIVLRILRNNQEFLYFSGVLAGLYYFYNNNLFSYKLLKYVYLMIDVLLCLVFIAIRKETISMLFPLTTFLFLLVGRFIFLGIFNREPRIDVLLNRESDKLYTFLMFILIVTSWVAIIVKFMDQKIL
jgi:hypothetical protein